MLASIIVTSLNDAPVTGPDSETGTLRWAVSEANNTSELDVIKFAEELSGNVALTLIGNIDPSVGPSALLVSSPITIVGNANGITITRGATATDRRLFHVAAAGNLTFESITLHGGTARGANGGPGQNGQDAVGGAVYNQGTLAILASTLDGNSAIGGIGGIGGTGGSGGVGLGGAIYNDGGTVSIQNSTLSGNSATGGTGAPAPSSAGGAIYGRNGLVRIYNSTITNNSANSGRQVYVIGLGAGQTATAEIYSSIIAQADTPALFDVNAANDDGGTIIVTGGNNLIRIHNVPISIVVSPDDPLLGLLANNGGPTSTHALLADSPAVGLGSNPLDFANDQRGNSYSRVAGGTTDIGSFELQTVATPSLPGDYNRNDIVDAADYVVWRKTNGNAVPQYEGADGNGTSTIDPGDYDVWRGNYGATPPEAAIVSLTSSGVATGDIGQSVSVKQVTLPLDIPIPSSTSTSMVDRRETTTSRTMNDDRPRIFDLAILELSRSGFPSINSSEWLANHSNSPQDGPGDTDSDSPRWIDRAFSRSHLQTASRVAASICTA